MFGDLVEMFWNKGMFFIKNVIGVQLTLLIFAVALIVFLYVLAEYNDRYKAGPYPPGPWGFPIVGHLPLLEKIPTKTLAKYRKQFGDVYSIRMGSYPAVVLNGAEVIKAAMKKYAKELAGRPQIYTSGLLKRAMGGGSGITFATYGPAWKIHRKIASNAMAMFVNSRNTTLEELTHEEGTHLVDFLLAKDGLALNPCEEIRHTVARVMYQLLFGRQNNIREDETFCRITTNLDGFFRLTNTGSPFDIMPWTRFLFRARIDQFLRFVGTAFEVSSLQVERHRDTNNPGEIRDVTDALLQKADDISSEEKRTLGLTNAQIISIIPEVQAAGADTIGTALQWAILYMANFPAIQHRVHSEIDKELGATRLPNYEDRTRMPYVEATLLEILRSACIAPLSFPHETTDEVTLQGYRVPKGTFVLINLSSTCTDPEVWGDPEVFKPERFLLVDPGNESKYLINKTAVDNFLVFGVGKRRCFGEFLAKAELFILFTMIMQRCSFSKVQGENYDMEGSYGFLVTAKPYTVISKARQSIETQKRTI